MERDEFRLLGKVTVLSFSDGHLVVKHKGTYSLCLGQAILQAASSETSRAFLEWV